MEVPKGDYGYQIVFSVKDANNAAYNLTGYTIKLKVWTPGIPGTLKVNGTCTLISAVLGTCYYVPVAADFDTVGSYKGEIELTKAGAVESTEPFTLTVKESG